MTASLVNIQIMDYKVLYDAAASQRLADTPEEMARQLLDDAAGELAAAQLAQEAARAFIEQAQELLAAAGRN